MIVKEYRSRQNTWNLYDFSCDLKRCKINHALLDRERVAFRSLHRRHKQSFKSLVFHSFEYYHSHFSKVIENYYYLISSNSWCKYKWSKRGWIALISRLHFILYAQSSQAGVSEWILKSSAFKFVTGLVWTYSKGLLTKTLQQSLQKSWFLCWSDTNSLSLIGLLLSIHQWDTQGRPTVTSPVRCW